MSAADRHGGDRYRADRYGADRYGADRYGPGRFPGTHVHDAHEGCGAVQGSLPPVPGSSGDDGAVRAGAPLGESVPAGMRAVLAARAAERAAEDAAIAAAVADVRAANAAAITATADPADSAAAGRDALDRDALGRLGRHDGWTGERQRDFLAAIAEGHTVERACRLVGLSVASAYALRRRAGGAAFALGWQAAGLLAREHVADTLLARAIEGQTETVTRPNGDVIERHRYDNRLAMSLLARLDRQAEGAAAPGGVAGAGGGAVTHAAARMVAGEFDAFLDLIGRDGGPAPQCLTIERDGNLLDMDATQASNSTVQADPLSRYTVTYQGGGHARLGQRVGHTFRAMRPGSRRSTLLLAHRPRSTLDCPGNDQGADQPAARRRKHHRHAGLQSFLRPI